MKNSLLNKINEKFEDFMMYNDSLETWINSSYLSKNNQSYIEQIYEDFLNNPNSVGDDWCKIFKQLTISADINKQSFDQNKNNKFLTLENDINFNDNTRCITNIHNKFTYMKVFQLIHAFRTYGHQHALLDPLNLWEKISKNDFLKLEYYKFDPQDFEKNLDMTIFGINQNMMTLPKIYKFLKKTYCKYMGIEYTHILDADIIYWIQQYFESEDEKKYFLNIDEKKQFLKEIIAAEGIERYLSIAFPGVKRFSLEGGDALIPMLKEIVRYSTSYHNIQEIFFGMAHRGRLNVLINILGKNPQDLFDEFSSKNKITLGSGDVKYHQGFHSEITINKRSIHLSLLYNPSHLEIVSPVVMGAARARIDQIYKQLINDNSKVLSVKIHGDAAISGQGIVQETFNMSKTRAYDIGGTIHIVINNQIGFTTSNITDIRSTQYCTDIAKMIQSPIFHVNADDVESVIYVSRAALNFRNKFKRDVIIDLICYRRHGHNEVDEPSVTQPLMYQKIHKHPTLLNIYANKLTQIGIITSNDITEMVDTYQKKLENKHCVLQKWQPITNHVSFYTDKSNNDNNHLINHKNKKITSQYLKELAYRINNIPLNIVMHPRVKKIYQERIEMALGNRSFDWGGAETLAYATLLNQNISIRLSGEDVARGTFFHRHAVIYDQNHEIKYIPLKNAIQKGGSFFVWDSVLSEEAALAFEYGYSCVAQKMLVIWEAQFGDFSNGAQVVIDQFISSGEQKWNQLCNLVIYLPHGYEGQGPEHSSARIERYLQLCAENNIYVYVPSTPAQIYHALCQQSICNIKKPLIIISPKSLLRHPMAISSLDELAYGSFKKVFDEIDGKIISDQICRVIICTGKIYYDLLNQRQKNQQYNVSIIRIEQLYPFPYTEIEKILSSYTHVKKFFWCQEEPKNQGAWYYIQNCFFNIKIKNIKLNYIGRPASAAPAVGYFFIHQKQQKKLIDEALNLY